MSSQLFEQITGAIRHHSNQQQKTGFDPSPLLSHVQDLFGQHATNTGQPFSPRLSGDYGNVRPASRAPYGDPADQ